MTGESVSWWRYNGSDAEAEFISYSDGILLNGFAERCRMDGDDLVFHELWSNDTGEYICAEEAGQGLRHVTQLNVTLPGNHPLVICIDCVK